MNVGVSAQWVTAISLILNCEEISKPMVEKLSNKKDELFKCHSIYYREPFWNFWILKSLLKFGAGVPLLTNVLTQPLFSLVIPCGESMLFSL